MTQNTSLNHLAIIPDGNRRWAKQHLLSGVETIYQQGSDTTFNIVQAAFNRGIRYVTFWASSYANLADRSKAFADTMDSMYAAKFDEIARHPMIHDNRVRIMVCGRWRELVTPATAHILETTMQRTSQYNSGLVLTVLVGYDGRQERGAAVQQLLANNQTIPTDPLVADQLLRQHAWTAHLPDVDLLLRTGAWQDPHNSAGFLSLQTAESQLVFPPVLWPDFTPAMLTTIVADFTARERRMGK